jgi:hypothetical protein
MAALLAIFHPVPPVIRKRAKELLDAIRTTVKAALAPPPAPPASETVEATEPTSAVEIDAEELVEPEASAEPLTTSIWTSGKHCRAWNGTLCLTFECSSSEFCACRSNIIFAWAFNRAFKAVSSAECLARQRPVSSDNLRRRCLYPLCL